MNLNSAQYSLKSPPQGGRAVFRMLATVLCIVIFTAVPALAEPVRINQVIQTLSSSQGAPELKLNTLISQDPGKGSTQQGTKNDGAQGPGQPKTDSVVTGVTVTQGQQIGVDIIDEGQVEGTICDCGEILIAGGGIPKWPFLFLGAVPLIFIDGDSPPPDEIENQSPTPTPTPSPSPTATPPPPAVPEPASLFLFGTGLAAFGAGLRRRYTKSKLAKQIKAQGEE